MIDQKVKSAWDQANELFDSANEHLCKPEEDVVTYVVCHTLYKASIHYLKSYLLHKEVEIEENANLATVLAKCRETDPRFNNLKLEPQFNANVTDEVWMSLDKVNEFVDLTQQTKDLVMKVYK
ncbi:MAG: hypothetical protein RH860_09925 [Cytophagales bacterium]